MSSSTWHRHARAFTLGAIFPGLPPMLRNFRLRLLLPCLSVLLGSACNAPTPGAPAVAATGTHSPQVDLPRVDAASASALAEEGRGVGYEFHIRYPDLPAEWSALNLALRSYATQRKQQFLAALSPVAERGTETPLAALDLEFDIARRTEDFVSVLARETAHSGADAAPATASFVLHLQDDKLLSIVDLFTTPDAALQTLSDECRRQLQGRYEAILRQSTGDAKALEPLLKRMQVGVEHGTQANAANFAVFLIDGIDSKAIGLTLIFPQSQLAAVSGGEQQVEVPAKVFYDLLKPEYRDAFSVDTEELKHGVR